MKKVKLLCLGICCLFLLSGCGVRNYNLDNAEVYTTVYPVKYITEYLYGENSTVESIYPDAVDINSYTLTDKQINAYSSGDLFVYVGLGKEKEIAKQFINKNKNLLIIDATYGLSSNNNISELWIAPNNFLMLAKNIKTSLNEYLDNSVKEETVTKKYNELYEKVSWIDAELRNIAKEAKASGNNTIVIASNTLKFLENYGFNVVSLEDIEKSGSENAMNDIRNKFKNSKYSDILKVSGEADSELVKELKEKNKANVVEIKNMISNSDSASDYISMQNENLSVINDLLLK